MSELKFKCEKCDTMIKYETDGKLPLKHICSKCKKTERGSK